MDTAANKIRAQEAEGRERLIDHDALPEDIAAYHWRTKHRPTRYALGPAFLDWTSQPSPYRRFEGAPLTELPLLLDRPTPAFPGPAPAPAALSTETLGLFFELGFGLAAWKSVDGATWALRNNPSSGNLHPTEAYAILDALAGLNDTAALYHYAPQEHGLERRATFAQPQALPKGGFLLGLSAVPWREAWKYGERAFRYCQLDAGHAIGCAAMAAATLGWRASLLTEPTDAEVAALLGLDRPDAWRRWEVEHPDALLWIDVAGGEPPPLDLAALLALPRDWRGEANRLSEDHDPWPAVDRALALTRKAQGASTSRLTPRPVQTTASLPQTGAVVRGRRSAQRMDGKIVAPLESLRAMLAATLPDAAPLLPALSFPPRINLLLFVHRVEGLAPGLYFLERDADSAARLRAAMGEFDWTPSELAGLRLWRLKSGAVEREASLYSCQQAIAGKGCFAVSMISDFERTIGEEGAFAYRRLHWEAGLIGQALYLWATALGLTGTGIGCFFDDQIHGLIGLAPEEQQFQTVYHFTVGGAVEDARLLTLPAYPDSRRGR
ncbi:SagB/ThcOx family dehydrogenase [Methylocystis bryophila]|uniref:SagB/ThcOx family dehydrogenase n=1 Tax=Methylocystis bryophila TaxID=655015 RepID=UPI000A2678BC|nr:SagB/ThcOx family dehydrogenase [Methylocystis bryophila]